MSVYTSTSIDIEGARVSFHCEQCGDRATWRLNTDGMNDVYFTGTSTELLAFGEEILRAASERLKSATPAEVA